uniref:Xenopus laevis tandemly arranged embryonic U1 snRNA genes U1a/U1b n=1 Tax=Xenopus laevis TaxID=8355 RepID=Q91873_XENLA|nr:unnamed protein product [Xenopus laevis]
MAVQLQLEARAGLFCFVFVFSLFCGFFFVPEPRPAVFFQSSRLHACMQMRVERVQPLGPPKVCLWAARLCHWAPVDGTQARGQADGLDERLAGASAPAQVSASSTLLMLPTWCWSSSCAFRRQQLILTWQGRYHDHEGGSPRARLSHCTPAVLTPAISPNAGKSTA